VADSHERGMLILNDKKRSIEEILITFPSAKRFSLAILQEVQKEYKYISPDNLKAISNYLAIPISDIFSMATYYKSLSLEKKGEFIIKVCDGTACHIRGSLSVLDEVKRALNINEGETTPDGLFSLEIVNCVGACAMAPVVICNQDYFGNVKLGKAKEIINSCVKAVD